MRAAPLPTAGRLSLGAEPALANVALRRHASTLHRRFAGGARIVFAAASALGSGDASRAGAASCWCRCHRREPGDASRAGAAYRCLMLSRRSAPSRPFRHLGAAVWVAAVAAGSACAGTLDGPLVIEEPVPETAAPTSTVAPPQPPPSEGDGRDWRDSLPVRDHLPRTRRWRGCRRRGGRRRRLRRPGRAVPAGLSGRPVRRPAPRGRDTHRTVAGQPAGPVPARRRDPGLCHTLRAGPRPGDGLGHRGRLRRTRDPLLRVFQRAAWLSRRHQRRSARYSLSQPVSSITWGRRPALSARTAPSETLKTTR